MIIYKLFIILLILITGCTPLNKVVYHQNINQGNFLINTDITKIHIGMTKKQVIYILGTPILKEISDPNIWYYIFLSQSKGKLIIQKTLILTFNKNDILIHIYNKV